MTETTTPLLIGLGQHSERIGEPSYEALSPADLAARAGRIALEDAGIAAGRVQVVACPRQFDETFPGMPSILGRPQSFPEPSPRVWAPTKQRRSTPSAADSRRSSWSPSWLAASPRASSTSRWS